ncbi:MAG: hypothetical protein IKH90_07700 [Ruminococcus sp.]|nr:hypothetical protein [Ruminococcus sp.]
MKNTNTTNNTNNINNINTAEDATAKVRKHNKKVIASIFAVVSAAAVITSIAVFTASASTIKDAPKAAAVTTASASAVPTTVKTEGMGAGKEVTKTPVTSVVKTEQTQTSAVNKDGKHPGEAGYHYYDNQKAAAAAPTTQTTNTVKHPGEAGYHYYDNQQTPAAAPTAQAVNTVKHPGESGYNYYENQKAAPVFKSGRYIAADGSRAELVIANPDNIVCYCTIHYGNTYNNDTVYGFMGTVKGTEIDYTRGSKNDMTYDNNGNVAKAIEIDRDHSGTIEFTKAGSLRWIDSDGTNVNFIPAQA